jgi:hypothetical protein
MTTFKITDLGNSRGFEYVDDDGDKLSAWRFTGGVYINVRNADESTGGTVNVEVADIPHLLEQFTRLSKNPCTACKGKGHT